MRRPSATALVAAFLLAALIAVLVRLAWVGDDTYITLRTVENVVQGRGPVWNVDERVQTYTHPLWMGLLVLARIVVGESFYSTIAMSLLLSLATALLLVRTAVGAVGAAAVLLLMLLSRSFTEYAVSGLENPLVFVLLVLFARAAVADVPVASRTRRTALLAALLALTRLDLGLLCAPVLLANLRGQRVGAWLGRTALGMAPLIAWFAFAAIYYGSPFPITAFAKATHVGIPASALLAQGLHYVVYVATHDPLTLAVVVAGIAVGLWRRELGLRPLALGTLLYCGYVVKVGGDFMGGRFFTPPFVAALAILARAAAALRPSPRALLPVAAVAVALALLPGLPPWTRGPAADTPPTEEYHGIIDERRFYYETQGLFGCKRNLPVHGVGSARLRQLGRTEPTFVTFGMVGRYAYEGGDLLHVVDPWLLDPLLMRLPVGDLQQWRIGHFARYVPEGYLESLATGENRFRHPRLAKVHDAVRLVVDRDVPLFAGERLGALWRLWTGAHGDDIAAYVAEEYRTPPTIVVAADEIDEPLPPSPLGTGAQWFDEPRARLVGRGGIEVRMAAPVAARALRLQLAGGDYLVYRVRCRRGGETVVERTVDATAVPMVFGLAPFEVELPAECGPIDAVVVDVPGCPSFMTPVLGSLVVVP